MSLVTLCFSKGCPATISKALELSGYSVTTGPPSLTALLGARNLAADVVLFDAVERGAAPQPEFVAALRQMRRERPSLTLLAVLDVRFAGSRALKTVSASVLAAGADDVLPSWGCSAQLEARLHRAVARAKASELASRFVGDSRHCAPVGRAVVEGAVASPARTLTAVGTASGARVIPQPARTVGGAGGAVPTLAPQRTAAPAASSSARQLSSTRAPQMRPQIDPLRRELTGPRGRVPLTAKESIVMRMLIEAPGVVLRQQLAEAVWTQGWVGTPKAIDMHISNLRKKLREVGGTGWRIVTVRGTGFMLEARAEAA